MVTSTHSSARKMIGLVKAVTAQEKYFGVSDTTV